MNRRLEQLEDGYKETQRELVLRARAGDREAFGDLVRHHRSQALGLAASIARDTFIAEDIVQDALIRAFMHIGTLMNADRFVPWLQRIVRNQAYMKLRRGGLYGKEQPFSSFSHQAEGTLIPTDWSDIDSILFRLAGSAIDEACYRDDPAESFLRADMLQCLRELLSCLGKRERAVFEAHFFDELTPVQIAALFQTKTANVYNILSRSRSKVCRERIRVSLNGYVQQRAALGLPKRIILSSPPI
ncbi:hypothetical protein BC351_30420 [Paenibacillus ferrarius]|uniref:RNA polymerase sigma factor n=1 Tax=Paenibacillus ferrarius TaxID=1469647 RepID=A0A1V4HGW5_9BACL|nr:RNA polymerase sigma factor [Paenibacillus ferrarius]OPH54767.1 hypothetical protein BC351_30420 [Paenibacillus ferrarius]